MAAPKRNVKFDKPEDPSFLKAFKSKVGYKEPDSIDVKFNQPDIDESKLDDREDREDEQPTVVVLKPGDLSQEEFKEIKDKAKKEGSSYAELPSDGKVVFKKPGSKRRKSSEDGGITASTKKTKETSEDYDRKKVKNKTQGVSNSSLLSFQEDDNDDDS